MGWQGGKLAAIRSLGTIATETGFVVEPFQQYPDLLPVLLKALAPTEPKVTRLEASRTLGILGALDPVQVWEEEKHNEQFDKPLRSPSQSSNESQYAAVGVAVVHRVLQDSDPCPVPRAERLTQTLDGRTVRSRSISGSNR